MTGRCIGDEENEVRLRKRANGYRMANHVGENSRDRTKGEDRAR